MDWSQVNGYRPSEIQSSGSLLQKHQQSQVRLLESYLGLIDLGNKIFCCRFRKNGKRNGGWRCKQGLGETAERCPPREHDLAGAPGRGENGKLCVMRTSPQHNETKRTIEIKKILPLGYLRSTEETWGLILRAAKSHSCEWRGYKLWFQYTHVFHSGCFAENCLSGSGSRSRGDRRGASPGRAAVAMPAGGDAGPAGAWGRPTSRLGRGKNSKTCCWRENTSCGARQRVGYRLHPKEAQRPKHFSQVPEAMGCCYRRKCTNQTCKSTVKVRKLFQSTVPFFIKAFFFLNKENN